MARKRRRSDKHVSFWKTLPGIFTASASLIAAITGLLVALDQIDLFNNGPAQPSPPTISQPDVVRQHDQRSERQAIILGGKKFFESSILVEIMARVIESDNPNLAVERRYALGETTDNFSRLKAGTIDIYPEYTGTVLTTHLGRDLLEVKQAELHKTNKINELLRKNKETENLTWLETFGFSNSFVLVMLKDKAEDLGIRTISDLSELSIGLKFKSTYSLYQRPDGLPGLAKEYKLFFKMNDVILHRFKYEALLKREIDVTDGYETDPELYTPGSPFAMLEDDREFFPRYYAAPFVNNRILERIPTIDGSLGKLAHRISAKEMSNLIGQASEQGLSGATLNATVFARSRLKEIVDAFLRNKGLL